MTWHICQCSEPACAFRFPAQAGDRRRERCPLCTAPTQCSPLPSAAPSERVPDQGDTARSLDSTPAQAPNRIGTAGPVLHLLLDNVRSTYNVGSLFRTADGAGVKQIELCGITPTPDHPKVAKTALGAEQSVDWRYHRNALHAAAALQAGGLRLWALETCPEADLLPTLAPPRHQPLALIIGNEITGVDPALLARCQTIVRLPMLGRKRSLNVASAAAIAIYWLRFAKA